MATSATRIFRKNAADKRRPSSLLPHRLQRAKHLRVLVFVNDPTVPGGRRSAKLDNRPSEYLRGGSPWWRDRFAELVDRRSSARAVTP